MQGDSGMDAPKPAQSDDGESVSVFLPKAITMGKTFKPGEEIVLKIVDVDPETGDLEAKYATDGEEESGEGGGMMDEFDKAMPEDKGNY